MNRILISAVAAAAMATSAFAYTDASDSMVEAVRGTLTEVGVEATMVEELTDGQIASIYMASTSEMDDAQLEQEVKKFLSNEQLDAEAETGVNVGINVDGGANSMMQIVDNLLTDSGFEVDVTTLTDSQIAAIYLAATSTDDESREKQKIEAILQ